MTDVDVDAPRRNRDVDWDAFDSVVYFDNNYKELRSDDKQIIDIVTPFFMRHLDVKKPGRAIDVGTGTNLYPAMIMLPYVRELILFEQASSNRAWLNNELGSPHPSWNDFWNAVAADRPDHEQIEKDSAGQTHNAMRARSTVQAGNVFDLRPDLYDFGTMFFVAESITTHLDEFRRAVGHFVGSLKAKAPFAAAFMRDSSGYWVGPRHFPACSVSRRDVRKALAPIADDLKIVNVESKDLRVGYGGMIVATGIRK